MPKTIAEPTEDGRSRRHGRYHPSQEVIDKRRATRERNKTDFQRDLAAFKKDPVVWGLTKSRRQLFNLGESVREIESILKKRFKQLRKRG